MTNPAALDAIRDRIATLATIAMDGGWESGEGASVLRVMGREPLRAQDVPVASEMLALLQHYATVLPVLDRSGPNAWGDDGGDVDLRPGIVWGGSKLVALIDVPSGQLPDIAYWLTDKLQSPQVKAMPGILALPFTIEQVGEEADAPTVLFPEWCAAFYPFANPRNAFPILALRSILSHDAIGDDWVGAAIGRMAYYGLPRSAAEEFMASSARPA